MTNDRWPIWMRALRPDELTRRRMKRAILDEALPLLTARRDSWFDAVADWATILSPVAAAVARRDSNPPDPEGARLRQVL